MDYEWGIQPITVGKGTVAQEHVPGMPHFTVSVEQEASAQEVELDCEPQVQPQKPMSSSRTLRANDLTTSPNNTIIYKTVQKT